MPRLEKEVERKICDYAKMLGALPYKFVSPGTVGVPDRLFVLPGGRVAFLEVKRPGEKPAPDQLRQMALLAKAGASVAWFDDAEEACRWLCEIFNRR